MSAEDVAAIRQLKARYCRLLDTRQWDAWGEVFLANAVLDVSDDVKPGMGDPEVVGRDIIVDQTRRLVGEAITVHQVHEPEIEMIDADHASGIWPMHDLVTWPEGIESPIRARMMRAYGWYHELYERTPDGWRIARLKLVRQHAEVL